MELDGRTLRRDGEAVDRDDVDGFAEHFDVWTGRGWLEVVGPGWRVPVDARYGALRTALRTWFPTRPFTSDWADGRFPASPFGLPPATAVTAAVVAIGAASMAAGWVAGPAAGLLLALAGTWPLVRLRDRVEVREEGLRIGPAWAARSGWHEVEHVRYRVVGRRARVWARTRHGGGVATVPALLVPALRARLWRLGGLELEETGEDVDALYDRLRGPATGIPWGILVATAVASWWTPEPWSALTGGLLAMAATAALAAAVEARATGWHIGGVLWTTGAYAVVIAAIALGTSW